MTFGMELDLLEFVVCTQMPWRCSSRRYGTDLTGIRCVHANAVRYAVPDEPQHPVAFLQVLIILRDPAAERDLHDVGRDVHLRLCHDVLSGFRTSNKSQSEYSPQLLCCHLLR